jgi:carbon monoxide dehydrogenase subunit G
MQLTGEVTITAAREQVWAALNNPDVLARCIEGVETLTRVASDGGDRFEGKMNAKVGPVRATFTGQVTLTDVVEPESYVLVGEGKGGVAGFAKGQAAVTLEAVGAAETLLRYDVTSSVGGKLAQLGARLIEGTAKGYATSFFARLKDELEAPAAPMAAADALASDVRVEVPPARADAVTTPETDFAIPDAAPSMPAKAGGVSPVIWGAALVVAVLAFLLWQWN